MVSFATLVLVTIGVLGVPLKGSALALGIGGLLFTLAATGLGLMISAFVRSQVAAIFATALICLIPRSTFPDCSIRSRHSKGLRTGWGWGSVLMVPDHQPGTFTKGLGVDSFATAYAALGVFALTFIFAARFSLGKQAA
jgi:ribosome-dependent ATPase